MTDVRKTSPWRRFHRGAGCSRAGRVWVIPAHDTPARAEENDAIKFGPVTLTHVTETGDPVPPPRAAASPREFLLPGRLLRRNGRQS